MFLKNKVSKVLCLTLMSALTISSSLANADGLQLGTPSYGGTGCPAGTASVSVSPDQQAVSVLFDQFQAEAGRTTGRRIDRKSCMLSIPVQVPQGYSVAVFQMDYRGYNAVPNGGMNRFDTEYFWAGARGPHLTRVFSGPINDNFTVTDGILATALVWTPCGASTNLRVNASMMAQSNASMEQTIGSVDSADVSSSLIYHIQWRRCQ